MALEYKINQLNNRNNDCEGARAVKINDGFNCLSSTYCKYRKPNEPTTCLYFEYVGFKLLNYKELQRINYIGGDGN